MSRFFLILLIVFFIFIFVILLIKVFRWIKNTNFFNLFFNFNKKVKNNYYKAKLKSLELEEENQKLEEEINEKIKNKNLD